MNSEEEVERLLHDNPDWGLTSPLLKDDGGRATVINDDDPRLEHHQLHQQSSLIHCENDDFNDNYSNGDHTNDENQLSAYYQDSINHGEENDRAEGVDRKAITFIETDVRPRDYYQILLGAMFIMNFILLVLGSYYFEWSDTILRVQVDTLLMNSTSIDNEVIADNMFELGQTLSVDLVSPESKEAMKKDLGCSIHVFLLISRSLTPYTIHHTFSSLHVPTTNPNRSIGLTHFYHHNIFYSHFTKMPHSKPHSAYSNPHTQT